MKEAINKAIEEFTPLYDDVTTSDLQGIVDARSMQIVKSVFGDDDYIKVMAVSDEILTGIYEKVKP